MQLNWRVSVEQLFEPVSPTCYSRVLIDSPTVTLCNASCFRAQVTVCNRINDSLPALVSVSVPLAIIDLVTGLLGQSNTAGSRPDHSKAEQSRLWSIWKHDTTQMVAPPKLVGWPVMTLSQVSPARKQHLISIIIIIMWNMFMSDHWWQRK